MSDGISWQNPPRLARGRKPRDLEAIVSPLAENPGRWALVDTLESTHRAQTLAAALKRCAINGGTVEAVTRTEAEGVNVYARVVES